MPHMKKFFSAFIALLFVIQFSASQNPIPGYLANPGFENTPVKSVLFYSGNWRNGIQFYDFNPADNTGLYTIHPDDARHLGWSEDQANRDFAVQAMLDAGVNVINMSYWGLPGTDNWAWWAPMQTSTASHDELFNAALGKDLLIAPFIESIAPTDDYEGYFFPDDFPGTEVDPAPVLVTLVEDLVNRYLITPANAQWPSKWAKINDRYGQERYLVSLLHVASNQEAVTAEKFAAGFDLVAAKVFENTGIHIGFALDILPDGSNAPGSFKATAATTGGWLYQQESVLAVQCYIPETWMNLANETDLLNWKKDYLFSWKNTGIKLIHDLTPGYDAHIVFPSSPILGNSQSWRDLQDQIILEFNSESLTYNSWNGYTLGMAGMPTLQYNDSSFLWLSSHFSVKNYNSALEGKEAPPPDQLEILPNPAVSYVRVRLKDPKEQIISYKLYDSKGMVLRIRKSIHNNGSGATLNIPLEGALQGVYFLIVNSNKYSYTGKILKLE